MSGCGNILIVTGDGKGKTTTALGHALRTLAQGGRVSVIQILKGGGYSGELFTEDLFGDRFVIRQFGAGCPISAAICSGQAKCTKCGACFRGNREPERGFAPAAWNYFMQVAHTNPPDLIVLDELAHAVRRGLLPEAEVVAFLRSLPSCLQLIITGRNVPPGLAAVAGSIIECEPVKHPMAQGIDARRGIEY